MWGLHSLLPSAASPLPQLLLQSTWHMGHWDAVLPPAPILPRWSLLGGNEPFQPPCRGKRGPAELTAEGTGCPARRAPGWGALPAGCPGELAKDGLPMGGKRNDSIN